MTDSTSKPDSYEKAGVNISVADLAVQKLTNRLRSTWPSKGLGRVLLDFGHYANVVDIGGGQGIAICTDGIGSKALLAEMTGEYRTIGIDCVAMNVNDLVCIGAKPLTFVDYIASESVQPEILKNIGEGLVVGAELAGVSITGGEIAELPDMIRGVNPGEGFDLAGTAIGTLSIDKIITGNQLKPGDSIVGIASNGIHSNGMTLARKIFFSDGGFNVDSILPELSVSLGEELLKPTNIYVREVLSILNKVNEVKAIFHITGDGFLNLLRTEAPVGFMLDALPHPQPIFEAISKRGNVPATDMYSIYNMGVGLCVVVPDSLVDKVISASVAEGKEAWRIGTVTSKEGQVIIPSNPLDGRSMASEKKRFIEI